MVAGRRLQELRLQDEVAGVMVAEVKDAAVVVEGAAVVSGVAVGAWVAA